MPRISIILPTHNRAELLAEAIQSVLCQTFTDWELIVVDDASSPPAVVPSDPRIHLMRTEASQGGAASKSRGIEAARGEFVAYLDDDDLYHPDYLLESVALLSLDESIGVVFMGVDWFGTNSHWGQHNYDIAMARFQENDKFKPENGITIFDDDLLPSLLRSVPMAFQRPVVRRNVLAAIGSYRPDCLLWDCDWAIRAAMQTRSALIHRPLYRQRSDGQGYSSRQNRILEHLLSGIEIMDHTRELAEHLGASRAHIAMIRSAQSRSWFDLSWHYYNNREPCRAVAALMRSARHERSTSHLKLLARIIFTRWSKGTPLKH